jgi:hypothetical protein
MLSLVTHAEHIRSWCRVKNLLLMRVQILDDVRLEEAMYMICPMTAAQAQSRQHERPLPVLRFPPHHTD